MAEFLYRIGGFASRRSRTVVVAWFAILADRRRRLHLRGRPPGDRAVHPGHAHRTGHRATRRGVPGGGRRQRHDRLPDGRRRALTDAAEGRRSAPASPRPRASTASRRSSTRSRRRRTAPPRSSRSPTAGRSSTGDHPARAGPGAARRRARRRPKRPARSTRPRPSLAAKQAELDAARPSSRRSAAKLDEGAALLDMSSGIRLVSEDGSAAVAPVMFKETQFDVAPATKQAVEDAFGSRAHPGRLGRLLLGDRIGHPEHHRRRRAGRPARRRRSSSWSCSAPSSAPGSRS